MICTTYLVSPQDGDLHWAEGISFVLRAPEVGAPFGEINAPPRQTNTASHQWS
jgi:hypothetical protein